MTPLKKQYIEDPLSPSMMMQQQRSVNLSTTNRTYGMGFPLNTNQQLPLDGSIYPVNLKSPAATTKSMFKRHEKRARSIALNNLEGIHKQYRVKGGSPGGVFLYDSSRKNPIDDENQTSIVDFIKRNLNIGKEQKNMDFERAKEMITKIYQKIKKRKDYGLDMKNLFNIQSCLNPKLKQHFVANQGYFQIFSEANILNQTFIQIIDQVSCYRLELGLVLQKMVESYNSIILQQFEEFFRSENEKEKELALKLIQQQQASDELVQKKLEYERRMDAVQALIQGKDAQISSLQDEQETLDKEVKYLRELIDLDSSKKTLQGSASSNNQVDPNLLNTRDNKIKAISRRQSTLQSKVQNEKANIRAEFSDNIQDLNDVLKSLENEQNEKKNILSGMDKLLQTMLKTTKVSVGTQVEDGELFWKPQNYLGDSQSQLSKSNQNQRQKSSRMLLSETGQGKTQSQASMSGVKTIQNQQLSQQESAAIEESKDQRGVNQLQYQAPMEEYGNTQKILMLKEEERILELEQKLNSMVNAMRIPDRDKEGNEQVQSLWSIPSHILIFIANSIEEGQMGRVLPWPEFKSIIYDIYDHRIQYASEVNGVINTTYLSFEEYILIYFLDKYKLRRLAETKLIESLTSLKYYIDIWPRAKNFAFLLNIVRPSKVQSQSTQKRSTTANQSQAMIELSIPNVDIYLQEFFLHAYSILMQDKDHYLESKEGVTYMKVSHEEVATSALMTWFGDQDSRKWFHKVRRNVKKIKTSPLDDFETDYIDIDVLLNMYIEEYKNKKKINQKNLSKEFMKRYQEQEGLFNTEEIDKIVQSNLPMSSTSAFVKFPGLISIRRAFLYALVCGDNGFEVNTQEFIAGCNRFGLDNPCPIVTKRISLFGNDEDFEELIKRELIKSNIQAQTKMHTSKLNKGGLKIESARLSSFQVRQMTDVGFPSSNSNQRIVTGIQNLKLLGRGQTADLEQGVSQNILAGGVKLNIGSLAKDNGDNFNVGKRVPMTQEETSIGNKKIIIPSFSTTSALFSQHFSILRDLKKRIEGLKQAYYSQREEDRSWEQVEKILHVLEAACKFLDFPIQT